MRILLTADTLGGVWTYALALSRALERHDVEIALATMGAPLTAAQHSQVRSCRNIALYESGYRLEWMPEPWADVAAAGEWLRGVAGDFRAEVVHLNGYAHGAVEFGVPVLVVGHSCVLSWWQSVHGSAAPGEWDRYRAAVTAGLRAADVIAAPTAAMLAALDELYGPFARTCTIPNGCDATALPLGARDAFGRYQKPRRPHTVVLAAGRVWDESKNFALLSAAAPHIEWPVYIAGSSSGPSGQRQDLSSVHCLGALAPHAMAAWHRRASIFVHPALYEPFGLAPLEAALAGAALVLSDIPSLREVWGDTAVYVPPHDSSALAVAVNSLIRQPQRRAACADAARQRAAGFTARRMARSYLDVYAALAGGSTAGPLREAIACA
jgi:glycogen synthase